MEINSISTESIHKSWRKAVSDYQDPDWRKSVWQLVNTLIPYIGLWIVMVWSLGVSYWITLGLAIPAGGLVARLFIIFHDCGHGSFFKTSKANHWVGSVVGVLVFTPYFAPFWRQNQGPWPGPGTSQKPARRA